MRSKKHAASRSFICEYRVRLLPAMILLLLMPAGLTMGQAPNFNRELPTKPFHVIGNIYYVGPVSEAAIGPSDATSFLIVTPEGHILVDSVFENTVPLIRKNVEAMGIRFEDIKILLNSHAHADHMAGHKLMKELTGAEIYMTAADAAVMADGGRSDFRSDGRQLWQPVEADYIIEDGDTVTLGGVTMTAHLTPGHTKGCTTWTFATEENGVSYDVVIAGGVRPNPNVPLVDNPKYPEISEDFVRSFATLRTLDPDVFLAVHGNWFDLPGRARAVESVSEPNPFIDPQAYQDFIVTFENQYLDKLEADRALAGDKR